jgi:hypothetical protein
VPPSLFQVLKHIFERRIFALLLNKTMVHRQTIMTHGTPFDCAALSVRRAPLHIRTTTCKKKSHDGVGIQSFILSTASCILVAVFVFTSSTFSRIINSVLVGKSKEKRV